MRGAEVSPNGGRAPCFICKANHALRDKSDETLATGVMRGALDQTSAAKGQERSR